MSYDVYMMYIIISMFHCVHIVVESCLNDASCMFFKASTVCEPTTWKEYGPFDLEIWITHMEIFLLVLNLGNGRVE